MGAETYEAHGEGKRTFVPKHEDETGGTDLEAIRAKVRAHPLLREDSLTREMLLINFKDGEIDATNFIEARLAILEEAQSKGQINSATNKLEGLRLRDPQAVKAAMVVHDTPEPKTLH